MDTVFMFGHKATTLMLIWMRWRVIRADLVEKGYFIEPNGNYDIQVGKKTRTDSLSLIFFLKERLVLLSAKLHLGHRKSVYKKSLWQPTLSVQTKLALILLTLCLYCALI